VLVMAAKKHGQPWRNLPDVRETSEMLHLWGPKMAKSFRPPRRGRIPWPFFEAQARCWALDERHGRKEKTRGPKEGLLEVKGSEMEKRGWFW
jgi:hypothetical protein